MTVYVDAPIWKLGRMKMCHMIADTLEELHVMADQIGVERKWFQSQASFPHYDIAKSKRAIAVKLGARDSNRHQFAAAMKRFRQTHEVAKEVDGWVLIAQLAVRVRSVRIAAQVAAAVSAIRKPPDCGIAHPGIEWMQIGAWRAKYESP